MVIPIHVNGSVYTTCVCAVFLLSFSFLPPNMKSCPNPDRNSNTGAFSRERYVMQKDWNAASSIQHVPNVSSVNLSGSTTRQGRIFEIEGGATARAAERASSRG